MSAWRDSWTPLADGSWKPLDLTIEKPGQGAVGMAAFGAGIYPACSDHRGE